MAGNYFALPKYQVPGNAMIDYAPINNALETMRVQRNVDNQMAMKRDEITYQRGRDARQDQRQDKADARGEIEWFGKQAAAVDQMQGPQRAAAWQNIIKRHPNAAGLTPDYLDPMKGPAMVAAEAGKFKDPVEQQARSLDMQYKRAQIDALNRKANDPVAAFLTDRLRGLNKTPQAAPAPQQPMLQPQSMDGGGVMPGGVTLIRDQQQPGAAPAAAAAPKMVDTPFGPMNPDEARQLGGAMLLKPQYATAGKAILDTLAADTGKLGKEGTNENDKRALNVIELSGRLDAIQSKFKPEYQTYETAIKMGATSWMDSFESMRNSIKPEDRQKLQEYTAFRQDAFNNLSQYIKEVTGAAMGIQEEARIRRGMPDPQKDSPTEFESKMKNSIRETKLALARYNHLKRNGYDQNTIANLARSDKIGSILRVEDMPRIIQQRTEELQRQAIQQGIQPQAVPGAVRNALKQEFGI